MLLLWVIATNILSSTSVGKIYVISHDTINNFELNSEVFLSFEKNDIKILDD